MAVEIEQVRELVAFVLVQERVGDGEASLIELVTQPVPIEFVDALGQRGGDRVHTDETPISAGV